MCKRIWSISELCECQSFESFHQNFLMLQKNSVCSVYRVGLIVASQNVNCTETSTCWQSAADVGRWVVDNGRWFNGQHSGPDAVMECVAVSPIQGTNIGQQRSQPDTRVTLCIRLSTVGLHRIYNKCSYTWSIISLDDRTVNVHYFTLNV